MMYNLGLEWVVKCVSEHFRVFFNVLYLKDLFISGKGAFNCLNLKGNILGGTVEGKKKKDHLQVKRARNRCGLGGCFKS